MSIGTEEEARKHTLVRSLEWLYNGFKTLFYEEKLVPDGDIESLRVMLGTFLRDHPKK